MEFLRIFFKKSQNIIKKKPNIATVMILVVAGAWALIIAARQQVWFDEAYSIWITKDKTLSETIALTSVDAHPPFYYLILNLWGNLVSWDFFGLRVLSILFFLLSIWVAIKFASSIFGRKVAISAGILLAFSPFLVRYSFEVRMYSLASLIAILSTYLFCLARKSPNSKRLWVTYAVTVAIGMWTLYTLAIVFLSHFAICVYDLWRKKSFKFWREGWFKSYTLAVILWSAWLPSFIYQLKHSASSGIGEYIGLHQIENMFNFLAFYKPVGAIASIWAILGLIGVYFLFSKSKKPLSKGKILVAMAFLPFVITIILSQPIFLKKPFFVERYMSQFVILLYLLLAILVVKIWQSKAKFSKIPAVIFTIILAFGNFNLYRIGNFNFQNYRLSNAGENMSKISQICEGFPVVMDDIYLFMELEVYNNGDCDMKIFTEKQDNYGGGYAPINKYKTRIFKDNLSQFRYVIVVMNKGKKADFGMEDFILESEVGNFENLSAYKFIKK